MANGNRNETIGQLNQAVRAFIAHAVVFNLNAAAGLGLNGTDLQLLNLLEMRSAATPGELARGTSLSTGGVTVALDRLEKAGYIRRDANPEDRRSTLIRLVSSKARKLRAMYKSRGEWLEKALAKFDDGELETILDFFTGRRSRE